MKKLILLIASLIFSTLFYHQGIGLNLFLFSILSIVILGILNPEKIIKKEILFYAFVYLIVSYFVFLHGSVLAISTSIVCFIVFIGSFSEHKSSFIITFINGFYSVIVAAFAKYYDYLDAQETKINTNKESQALDLQKSYVFWIKIIGIPFVVMSIFLALYRHANPVINDLISKINLSFISLKWLLFTTLAYYLFYNITNAVAIEPLTKNDLKTNNILEESQLKKLSDEKIHSENQLGTILIVLLNVLLLFLLITDLIYLNGNTNYSAVELSEQVHLGINALIISIMFAIIIIVYFFRGNLNFYDKNKALKKVTYLWIILNLILTLITAYKNYQYIISYGFTSKRIGVFVYLFLAFAGLIFTFIKVYKIKNIAFLFRKNSQVAFLVLVFFATVNWSTFMTRFNIKHAKVVDIHYLMTLHNSNSKLLIDYVNENPTILKSIKTRINLRNEYYKSDLEQNTWQDMVYDNTKSN
jgi:hypothetical protein